MPRIHHLRRISGFEIDTARRQNPVKLVVIPDHVVFCPDISFCYLAPQGVGAEFGKAAFRGIQSYHLFVQADPSLASKFQRTDSHPR